MRISVFTFVLRIITIFNVDGVVQDFYWRDFVTGHIPYDAVEENNGRYIGQVVLYGYTMPAMILPHLAAAAVTIYSKRENVKDNIKILCSPDPSKFYWERVNFSNPDDGQMTNVVKGGYQYDENMFIGRANYDGEWKIGKVHDISKKNFKGLWIWNKTDQNVRLFSFDLLKYNSTIVISHEQIGNRSNT